MENLFNNITIHFAMAKVVFLPSYRYIALDNERSFLTSHIREASCVLHCDTIYILGKMHVCS